jgi:hypothetical protein
LVVKNKIGKEEKLPLTLTKPKYRSLNPHTVEKIKEWASSNAYDKMKNVDKTSYSPNEKPPKELLDPIKS